APQARRLEAVLHEEELGRVEDAGLGVRGEAVGEALAGRSGGRHGVETSDSNARLNRILGFVTRGSQLKCARTLLCDPVHNPQEPRAAKLRAPSLGDVEMDARVRDLEAALIRSRSAVEALAALLELAELHA